MNVSDLMIEVTRKCNMRCEHCLRGAPQNLYIERQSVFVEDDEPSCVYGLRTIVSKRKRRYN